MSDSSDDDVPIAQRQTLKQSAAAEAASARAPAAAKSSSDDDDDVPLARTFRALANTERKVEKTPKSAAKFAKKEKPSATKKGEQPMAGKNKVSDRPMPKSAPAKPASRNGGPSASKPSAPERVKKVYGMPGQTRDTPAEGDPLRRFYTSLLEQRPASEMARRWCATYGLLAREDAEAWLAEQARKKSGSPSKAAPRQPASGGASKKRKAADSDYDDDEDDFKSATKKKKPAPAKKPATKKEAEHRKKGKKAVAAPSSDSSEDSEGSGLEEIMPAKKQRALKAAPMPKPSGAGAAPKGKPRTAPGSSAKKRKTERDVAFLDGGMDGSDSEDDVPLLQRKKAA